jgi:hypothetical protein
MTTKRTWQVERAGAGTWQPDGIAQTSRRRAVAWRDIARRTNPLGRFRIVEIAPPADGLVGVTKSKRQQP